MLSRLCEAKASLGLGSADPVFPNKLGKQREFEHSSEACRK